MNKGLIGKISFISLLLLAFVVALIFVLPAFAALESGNVTLSPANNTYQNGTITLNATSNTDDINASFYYSNTSNAFLYTIYTNASCGGTICTYSWNTTAVTDGVYNITANVTNYTNWTTYNVTVTRYNITIDNTAPTLSSPTPSNNSYIQGSASQAFSIVVSDANVKNGTLYYLRQGVDSIFQSIPLGSCTGTNPTCTVTRDISGVGEGNTTRYYFEVYDQADNVGYNGTAVTYLVTTVDKTSPTYSGAATSPASAVTYSSGASYQFNITWTDAISSVSDVILEFNGENYTYLTTNISKSGSVYYKTLTDLTASESGYSYRWFANDSTDRWNVTSAGTYIINKASIPVTLTLNNGTDYNNTNVTITYGTQTIATGSATAGTAALYRDGSTVSGGTETITLAANTNGYAYKVNATGNANYSSNSSGLTYYLIINNKTPTLTLSKNVTNWGTGNTYPVSTNISGYEANTGDGSCAYTLYRGSTSVGTGSSVEDNNLLAAGSYVYVYNTSGCTNYSSGSTTNTLVIDQGSTTMTLYVAGATPTTTSKERHTTNTLNLTASLDAADKTVSIYRNGALLSSGTTPHENDTTLNLTVGNYTYVANWTGDTNYTTSSKTVYIYINDTTVPILDYADPTPSNNTNQTSTSIVFNVTHTEQYPDKLILYINGTANTTQSYTGGFTNITLTNLYGIYTYYVWVNDTNGNTNQTSLRLVKVDNVSPSLATPTPSTGSYVQGSSSQTFSIIASDSVSQVKNGTLYYLRQGVDSNWQSVALGSCTGTNPTCTVTRDISGVSTGGIVQFYFEVYDQAGNVGYNGTAFTPLTTTVDKTSPTYANNDTNATTIKVGDSVLVYTQWSDTYSLSKAWLATNETGAWANKTANYSSPATLSGTSYWSNFTWQNASVNTGVVVQWKIYANDSAGNENVTAIGTFTIDANPPTYSNNATSVANNSEYVPTRNYGFQIDWADNVGVSDVTFQWGATNYTYLASQVSKSGSTYYYNLTNLAAGTYYYKWYANDTSNNGNSSFSNITYVVNLNQSNPVDVYIGTDKNQNVTITYGTSKAVNATRVYSSSGTAALYRDGSTVSGATETVTLAANTAGYAYLANVTGNANYSNNASGYTYYLIINNATLGGSIAGTGVTYPSAVNIGSSESNSGDADVNYTFWRNNTLISSASGSAPTNDTSSLAAAVYTYVLNSTGGANYSSNSSIATSTITVAKNSSNPVDLYLNNGTEYKNLNVTIMYGTTINATSLMTYSGRGSADLYRNNSNVTDTENNTSVTLAASTYKYVANTSGNTNYSANATGSTYYLTVNRNTTPTCSLTFDRTSPINYGINLTATCTCTNPEGSAKLYRNGTDVDTAENGINLTRAAGAYNYTCNVSQTENYTSATNSTTFTISRAPTSITLYLNGTEWTSLNSTNYPNVTNVTAVINVSSLQTSVGLERSFTAVSNPDIARLAYGYWNYTAYFLGNTNYSASQNASQLILINKGTPTLTLSSSPGWSPTDVQATTVTCSASSQDNEVSANLYRNGTDVNSTQNGIAQFYVVGVYNYTCNTTTTTNYSATSTSQIMTVTGTKGSIDGYITDSSGGSGIQGASVYISGYSAVATTSSGYYLLTDIIPGTYIVTVDKSGYTSNSTSATVTAGVTTQKNMTMVSTTDTTAPLQPTSLAAVQVGSTRQVNITWTASTSSDVTGYYVYRASGAVTASSTNLGEAGNTTRFTDTVPADGTWNYTVVAHDVVPNVNTTITASASVTVTTTDTTAPVNPSSVSVAQFGSTKQINVSWTASASSDAVRYNVYYKLSGAVTTSDNSFLVGNVTKTSIPVGSDGNWNFTVTTIDSSNNENTTIITSANITIDTTAPTISAVNSPVGAVTSSTVVLNVTTSEASSCKYNESDIQYGSMTATMTQGGGNSHNVTLTGLISEQAYDYYIRCNDTAGNVMTSSTHITFTPYTGTVMMVVNGQSGTTTDNTPLLNVSTNQSATCKYSATTNNYGSMTTFDSTVGTTHLHNLSVLTDSNYNYFITCRETSNGKLRESSAFFSVDTRSLYNVTRPNEIFDYWNSNQWNSFSLPQLVLRNTTLATTTGTYNVTNVLASVAGNYTIIYYNPNETSTTWTSYTPGVGGTLTTFNDETGYRLYWIYINVTNQRLEIN